LIPESIKKTGNGSINKILRCVRVTVLPWNSNQ